MVRDVERVAGRIVRRRPVAAGIVVAHELPLTVLGEHALGVEHRAACLDIDVRNVKLGDVVGEGRRPEKLSRRAVEHPDAAALPDHDNGFAYFAALDRGIDPLDGFRIRLEHRRDDRSLVRVVEIPVVTGTVLVIPDEFAGLDIQRDGRVAVEIRRRRRRYRIRAAMPCEPGIGRRVGRAPVGDLAHWIVGARQAPGACDALIHGHVTPSVAVERPGFRSQIELPDLFARERVVR